MDSLPFSWVRHVLRSTFLALLGGLWMVGNPQEELHPHLLQQDQHKHVCLRLIRR